MQSAPLALKNSTMQEHSFAVDKEHRLCSSKEHTLCSSKEHRLAVVQNTDLR